MKFRRKTNRLKGYDYSQNGVYLITICTYNKEKIFGDIDFSEHAKVNLNQTGKILDEYIDQIEEVDNYIIMPNHIHLILNLFNDDKNRSIQSIVSSIKRNLTKEIGYSAFQKSFHDHVIQNENEYENIWNYVENNAERWREDCFYRE